MIKVLFFIPTLAHGGAERVLINLVNHMDYEKFDITVQTMFDTGIYKDKLNKQVRYIGGFPWYFRGNTLIYKLFTPEQLFKMYVKEDYDIIVSYLEGVSVRAISGCNNINTKLVCWIHTGFEDKEYAFQPFRNISEAEECYKRFDQIISVSEMVKRYFEQTFQNTSPEKLFIIRLKQRL